MNEPIHQEPKGIDADLLESRVTQEVFDHVAVGEAPDPALQRRTLSAFASEDRAAPAPPQPDPSPPAPPRSAWLRLLAKAKAFEQATHLWLYRHKYLKEEVARVRAMLEDSNGGQMALATRTSEAHARITAVASQLDDLARRLDDYVAAKERSLAELPKLQREITRLRGDLLFQRRRLARLADDEPARPAETAAQTFPPTGSGHFRLPEGVIVPTAADPAAERFKLHLELVKNRQPYAPGRPLLDLGCGAGAWLGLLREAGIEAYGVDANAEAVEICRQKGLPARHGEAFAHLSSLPQASLGTITAFHLIEHFRLEDVVRLIDEAYRILVPQGLLLLHTANPENLRISAAVHLQGAAMHPIMPQLLEYLVRTRGFEQVEVKRLNASSQDEMIREDSEAARRLNELLYGPSDFAVVAHRT